jgi:polysaccharide biosynthesis protein PslG
MQVRVAKAFGRTPTIALLVVASLLAGCETAKAAPVVPADGYGFAIGAAAEWMSPKEASHELDAVATTRASWLRVLIDWSKVEPSKGQFDWTYVDYWIDGAVSRDLRVVGLISYSAEWARPPGSFFTTPPVDPADFAKFATAVVERYGDWVSHWEVWNEPNLPIFFGYTQNKAERYTELLKAAYPAIKRAQPNSTVIAAGLSRSPGDDAPPAFMQRMYAAGAKGSFDAAATHPYIYVVDWLPADHEDGWAEVGRLHDVMAANGDGGMKIWLTELGAPTSDPDSEGVSQQDQAQQITDVLAAAAASDYAGPAFIYSIRDIDTYDRGDLQDNFGALLTSDWRPKVTAGVLAR